MTQTAIAFQSPCLSVVRSAKSEVLNGKDASANSNYTFQAAVLPARSTASADWMTDAEVDDLLVKRVQAGEQRAFELLVKRYQGKVIAAVGRLVKDRTECEDLAQEVFIRAYRAMAGFRGDSSFYTWIYRIALNTAKNFLSSGHRKLQLSDLETDIADQIQDPASLRDRATPEREMLRSEIERMVVDSVADLPPDIRTALTLREVDGLSYEEIAKVMDCPIGTVRSRIFRARDAVDKRVRPLLGA
jgi:RNA polymerase sigma-70 factor, ECF subfamily